MLSRVEHAKILKPRGLMATETKQLKRDENHSSYILLLFVVCWSFLSVSVANSVDPDPTERRKYYFIIIILYAADYFSRRHFQMHCCVADEGLKDSIIAWKAEN